jgi:hypothetical protein
MNSDIVTQDLPAIDDIAKWLIKIDLCTSRVDRTNAKRLDVKSRYIQEREKRVNYQLVISEPYYKKGYYIYIIKLTPHGQHIITFEEFLPLLQKSMQRKIYFNIDYFLQTGL